MFVHVATRRPNPREKRMKRMAFVVVAAMALMPVAGGLASATPQSYLDNPRERVFYSGSANRDNCAETHRHQSSPKKIVDVDWYTYIDKDGNEKRDSKRTIRFEQRPIKVYMVCQYPKK